MPFLGKQPTAGFASIVKDDLTADGSTTAFTLSKNVASANDIAVFVGNVRQEPTDAYTVSGTTLTMSAAPSSGINFYVLHIAGTVESSVVPAAGTTVPGAFGVSGDLTVDTNALKVDATNNRVGIGTASPTQLVDIAHSGSQAAGAIRIGDPSSISSNTGIYMRTTGLATIGAAGGTIVFDTNFGSSEKVRIDSDGMKFNGDTAAANALDDYEEGTWTPVIGPSGGSFASQTGFGRYTKIGNTVHAWGYGRVTNVGSGSGGIDSFSGLPFASINDGFPAGNRGGLGTVREDQRTGYWGQLFISAGATAAAIQSPEGSQFMRSVGIATNDTFLIDLTYKTAS